MRASILLIVGLSVFVAGEAHAQRARTNDSASVELSLSNEAGEARYRTPTTIGGQPDSELQYAVFLSEDRDIVGSAALFLGTDLRFGGLQLRLGPQAYAALLDEENEDVFALAIGASVRFDVIPSRRIAVVGAANWSPDILTFGSADNLTDMMARAEIGLSDRVIAFGGYRWFRLDLTMRDRNTLQNELFAGINWQLR